MQSSLFLYVGTEGTSSDNTLAKIEVMKQVLRSVKKILWPTNGREANVLDAVRLAVFRMSRSDIFKATHNVTRRSDGAESTCNNMAVSADATKSDNVHGNDVEKNEDERVIPNLQKSALREECCNKLNDCMGIVGIDSKGNVAIGTTSGTFLGSLPKRGELVTYLNAGIPIGDGPQIKRFNLLEELICKAREKNTSLPDSRKETAKLLSQFIGDGSFTIVITETQKVELYSELKQTIWAITNGTRLAYSTGDIEFREKY